MQKSQDIPQMTHQINSMISLHAFPCKLKNITVQDTNMFQIHLITQGIPLGEKLKIEGELYREFNKNFSSEKNFSILFHNDKPLDRVTPRTSLIQESKKKHLPGVKYILAVSSGKGGVGKSTVSSNLAQAFIHEGLKVGLLDCDVHGPSIQKMFGVERGIEISDTGKVKPKERFGIKIFSFGLLAGEQDAFLWRGPVASKSIQKFLRDIDWGELDILLLDLPPGTSDIHLTLLTETHIDGALIVTTGQDIALIDAHKGVTMFEKHHIPVLGVIGNMMGYSCPNCNHYDDIFGSNLLSLTEGRGLKKLGTIPLHKSVRVHADIGKPVSRQDDAFKEIFTNISKSILTGLTDARAI